MTDSKATTTELHTPAEASAKAETGAACMACGHSVKSHDRISSRYCDATIEHATTRKCICQLT